MRSGGYARGYSTFDNKTHLISTFLDFLKALVMVDDKILFKKIECYGVIGHLLNWIRSIFVTGFSM